MIRAADLADIKVDPSSGYEEGTAALTIELTPDHRYRGRAMAVPGAYWSRARKAYAVDNPDARSASAIIALFPEVLITNPELLKIREAAYGTARPYDYASELNLSLDLPDGLDGGLRLYDWQDSDGGYLRAILERDKGAFVGWEPGLGKTVVAAAFIQKLEAQFTLVAARNDAKEAVWEAQLRDLLPNHEILVYPDSTRPTAQQKMRALLMHRADTLARSGGGSPTQRPIIFVIHYQAIRTIAGDKRTKHRDGTLTVSKAGGDGWDALPTWDLMIYDESHRLANYNPNSRKNTQEGKALSRLRRRKVQLAVNLSGSAVMNRPDDLFGQLHFLFPDRYRAKWADWNDRYVDYVMDGQRKLPIGWRLDKLEELRRELGVFMVYRKKSEVFDLPPLIHQDIELDLLPGQRRVYDQVRDEFWARLEEGGIKAANAMDHLNKLRQIATAYDGVDSAKLEYTVNELEEFSDYQFVVFTWYKRPGHLLAERLGDDVVIVDGDVPQRHRPELLRRHADGKARVLVGSIATIGESLNLQYMHEAIRLDRSYNPQVNKQTIDRLDRHGQETRVTLRDLWAKDTVDLLRVKPNLASKDSLRKAVFG